MGIVFIIIGTILLSSALLIANYIFNPFMQSPAPLTHQENIPQQSQQIEDIAGTQYYDFTKADNATNQSIYDSTLIALKTGIGSDEYYRQINSIQSIEKYWVDNHPEKPLTLSTLFQNIVNHPL